MDDTEQTPQDAQTKRRTKLTTRPLTWLESCFVEAYCGKANHNGAEAARLAGYKGNGNVLKVQANRVLTRSNVQAAIEAKRAQITAVYDAKWALEESVKGYHRCTQIAEGKRVGIDEANGKGYLDMANRIIGAYAEDNRQRGDKIAIVLR